MVNMLQYELGMGGGGEGRMKQPITVETKKKWG